MTGEKVLLVDDETELLRTLSERMEARGLRVVTAQSGEEALEKVHAARFDAVILDLAMPGLDGIETLKRLKAVKPDLEVILLTGQATVQKGIEAIKLGASDFMEKPAPLQALLSKIEEASERRAVLAEKRTEEQLKDILGKKGW